MSLPMDGTMKRGRGRNQRRIGGGRRPGLFLVPDVHAETLLLDPFATVSHAILEKAINLI